ncbi:SIMPL domain-containing protein [Cohaesibacter haloalkalitolerans]|uniref:SIMPL domain-containing protein n=1 Tax=Cohaesibacter haloalkalitolerans TaxID=1162980 RepID=UPI000E65D75D|nr:SIMPL domain-containing protein [Cohaesibacter haloalkalitolerans]
MKKSLIILTTLLSLSALPALADGDKTGGSDLKSTIAVTGTGSLRAAPDMAILSAGVESMAKNAKDALADNNAKMAALMAELEKAGIEKKDIQTTNFNIHPQLVYPNSASEARAPEVVGYVVSNRATVRIHDLGSVGSVLTALVNAGSNDISGLSFDISNKKELLDEARKAALADARHKAELYATELGSSVDKLQSLSESGGFIPPQPMMMRAAKLEAVASDVPVAEGEMEVSITVNANWFLKDK